MDSTSLPITLSKSEFKRIFRITSPRTFREKYFTDEVIKELGLTVDDFNRLRIFDVATTKRIYTYFNINEKAL